MKEWEFMNPYWIRTEGWTISKAKVNDVAWWTLWKVSGDSRVMFGKHESAELAKAEAERV